MSEYKYYLADNGLGVPLEVYRGQRVYEDFSESGVQRAKRDGSWTNQPEDVKWLMNLWIKGEFSPQEDEITETQAMGYLNAWRQSGTWPGRE